MQWIEPFDLFLFDFDGILVDSEPLHYAAYEEMCRRRGIPWTWDYEQFCKEAHGQQEGIRHALHRCYPDLMRQEGGWEKVALEKREIYTQFLAERPISLMPGAERLLTCLQERNRLHCVVTNSWRDHVEAIKKFHPVLQKIPHWLTREDYAQPKPAPDGYKKAIALYGSTAERIIGFEDTFKGFKALSLTPARAVLICPSYRSHVSECIALGGLHFDSLEAIDLLH